MKSCTAGEFDNCVFIGWDNLAVMCSMGEWMRGHGVVDYDASETGLH